MRRIAADWWPRTPRARVFTALVLGIVVLWALLAAGGLLEAAVSLGSSAPPAYRCASGKSCAPAARPAMRLLITSPSDRDPVVLSTVAELRTQGFTNRQARDLTAPASAVPRSVVFTPAGLADTPLAVRQALLAQGVLIAALNVSLPQLEVAIGWQDLPGLTSRAPSGWLSSAAGYPIFSVVRQVRGSGVSSETSDVWRSANAFVAILRAKETLSAQ